MARQYISFDDDDSPLSTSVPSSSSSTASETASINESVNRNKSKSNLIQITEEEKYNLSPSKSTMEDKEPESSDKTKLHRNISIETSGSRDKFPTSPPEVLTPVNHVGIGELTPISVEMNKNFESPDNSDEILEVPTDISAVLTAVESKNRQEVHRKEEKINELLKENESLKDQVKKYVSAIQMLRRDDDGLNNALKGLQNEPIPDYKGEAKMFEKKLVQVRNSKISTLEL